MLMLGLKGMIRAHIEAIFSFFPILACLKLILMHFFSVCFPENKMKLVLFDFFWCEILIQVLCLVSIKLALCESFHPRKFLYEFG